MTAAEAQETEAGGSRLNWFNFWDEAKTPPDFTHRWMKILGATPAKSARSFDRLRIFA
jgi:hypothetical protein